MITCPTTGRTWPDIAGFELKDCSRCGGKIDTRRESWTDRPVAHGVCPAPQQPPI